MSGCAKKKLGRSEAERRAFWYKLRAYRCPSCEGWHLTSQLANGSKGGTRGRK